jgi:hypothetical protein
MKKNAWNIEKIASLQVIAPTHRLVNTCNHLYPLRLRINHKILQFIKLRPIRLAKTAAVPTMKESIARTRFALAEEKS